MKVYIFFLVSILLFLVGCAGQDFTEQSCDTLAYEFDAYVSSVNACDTVADCEGFIMTSSPFCDFYLLGADADTAHINEMAHVFTQGRCSENIVCELSIPLHTKTVVCEERRCLLKSHDDISYAEACDGAHHLGVGAALQEQISMSCLHSFAERTGDYTSCYTIADEQALTTCLLQFSDAEGCHILPTDTSARDECFFASALQNDDMDECYYAGEAIASCIAHFAVVTDTAAVCDTIVHSATARQQCHAAYTAGIMVDGSSD